MIELSNYLFNPETEPRHQETLITVQGKIINSRGSISIISGLPKARKTTLNLGILFSMLTEGEHFGFKCKRLGKVVYIDTEQSQSDMFRNWHYCKKITGAEPNLEQVDIYLFRTLDPEEIIQRINEIIMTDCPQFIFIDSLTDLVANINDILECKQVLHYLKNWTTINNISVLALLHQSKHSNMTLGHIGSGADRIAQTVLSVKKDPNNKTSTIIESKLMRSDMDFESYSVTFNESDYELSHVLSDTSSRGVKPNEINYSTHLSYVGELELEKPYSYTSLYSELKSKYGKGDNWTKQQLIPYLIECNFIEKRADRKYYSKIPAEPVKKLDTKTEHKQFIKNLI